MQDFYDKIEAAIKSEKVWMPGEIVTKPDGTYTIRNITQVTVENKGAPKGKHIFLSRKKPSDFQEQALGTFKHNEVRKTVNVNDENGQIIASDSTDAKGGVVYMKRIGAYVPKYKIEQRKTNERFLQSLELARQINERRQTRSASSALVNVGSAGSIADSIGLGGKL